MTININFEGLNKILCKFGKHRFTNWKGENPFEYSRICHDCKYYEFKKPDR